MDKEKINKILNKIKRNGYNYYYDNNHKTPFKKNNANCYDEVIPGSHDRTRKIRQLMHKKILVGTDNFTEQYGEIIAEMRDLMIEELIGLGYTERQASQWLALNVDFNHVKPHHMTNGDLYLSVDRLIRYE